jgi:hypothetical protein
MLDPARGRQENQGVRLLALGLPGLPPAREIAHDDSYLESPFLVGVRTRKTPTLPGSPTSW